jgi:5-methyltetrahydrofolate--homocysteine methyltransferase
MNLRVFLEQKVLVLDGAMGTMLMAYDLDLEKDYRGLENCSEVLCETRPDVVREIHAAYLEVGCDAVETNSFGSNRVVFAEFGLEARVTEFNEMAARLAREACDRYATPERPRFVFGSMGPGTRLVSLGQIAYDDLEDSYHAQAVGLVRGGSDALLIETSQDLLQMKAAINGCRRAIAEALPGAAREDTPMIVAQVTMETTGTMLLGTEIAAALAALEAMGVDAVGLNCATGPREMAPHVAYLASHTALPVSVLPNAGLPELVDGRTHYPLTAPELADWHRRFVAEDGVNIIGGCCGTTPEHLKAVIDALHGTPRPARTPAREAGATSMYRFVPYRQENAVFAVGERTNANGSRAFKDLLAAEDWDGITRIGIAQVKEGVHAMDVCVAYVGRPESADMDQVMRRFATQVDAPLMIDSTEVEVIETALKRAGGKCIVNSINFEDGEERPAKVMALARRFGAAVVALTIAEEGMAKTAQGKVELARRLYDFAVNRHGLAPSDLIIDPLTFTICTGMADDRRLGAETLEGIRQIRAALPEVQVMLGLSNISFGLRPAPRQLLNSVFLSECQAAGMNMAILNAARIEPLYKIPEAHRKIALDLIHDRRAEGYDPLQALLALFPEGSEGMAKKAEAPKNVEERLKRRIVDGDRVGLEADLDEALGSYAALAVVNDLLLPGMQVVGELFGAGQMQLPFVLQSAETMKAAVAYLEPHMERVEGSAKGTIVLATVKGDVHDIGKNLVDIILTNNGYRVVNLGIKQPVENIIAAVREHGPDAVGLSGLLVKSTVVMRESLQTLRTEGFQLPVLLGGAALTRRYVEEDCRAAYAPGRVDYARDAFDGLDLMADIVAGGEGEPAKPKTERPKAEKAEVKAPPAERVEPEARPAVETHTLSEDLEIRFAHAPAAPARNAVGWDGIAPLTPPFWGARRLESVPLQNIAPFINETMLYQFQWGFKKRALPERYAGRFDDFLRETVRPIFADLLKRSAKDGILQPQAVYGYWPCNSDGNDVIVYEPDGPGGQAGNERFRFHFPRQRPQRGDLCLADFFRPLESGVRDVVAFQLVTMGQRASDVAREWFAAGRYQDYLYLHGLTVEMAEAMAELVHQRIRAELGFAHEDARETKKLIHQGYRGSRYSFGYPACPNLADQRMILALLEAGKIGVVMSEEDQLHPEASTSAIVTLHPAAKYFGV